MRHGAACSRMLHPVLSPLPHSFSCLSLCHHVSLLSLPLPVSLSLSSLSPDSLELKGESSCHTTTTMERRRDINLYDVSTLICRSGGHSDRCLTFTEPHTRSFIQSGVSEQQHDDHRRQPVVHCLCVHAGLVPDQQLRGCGNGPGPGPVHPYHAPDESALPPDRHGEDAGHQKGARLAD